MNTTVATHLLPDVQSQFDSRDVAIDAVGVKDLRHPLRIRSGGAEQATVATLALAVTLPGAVKGTHMSRFVELVEAHGGALGPAELKALTFAMLERLDAAGGSIELRFPYFIRKTAPVSRAASLLDADVCWRASVAPGGAYRFGMRVTVAATSLCPCSKTISAYGAHNQRSHVTIEADLLEDVDIEELVGIAERSASCEVYGLLKRADEKFVTERAYDNPKFVEDLLRDVVVGLRADRRIGAFRVQVENFESIHNHTAFASAAHPA